MRAPAGMVGFAFAAALLLAAFLAYRAPFVAVLLDRLAFCG